MGRVSAAREIAVIADSALSMLRFSLGVVKGSKYRVSPLVTYACTHGVQATDQDVF